MTQMQTQSQEHINRKVLETKQQTKSMKKINWQGEHRKESDTETTTPHRRTIKGSDTVTTCRWEESKTARQEGKWNGQLGECLLDSMKRSVSLMWCFQLFPAWSSSMPLYADCNTMWVFTADTCRETKTWTLQKPSMVRNELNNSSDSVCLMRVSRSQHATV